LGVSGPTRSTSKPAVALAGKQQAGGGGVRVGVALVLLGGVEECEAVEKRLSAESILAPNSMFSLCSGGVLALRALYE
jgi:hypothetical protein